LGHEKKVPENIGIFEVFHRSISVTFVKAGSLHMKSCEVFSFFSDHTFLYFRILDTSSFSYNTSQNFSISAVYRSTPKAILGNVMFYSIYTYVHPSQMQPYF
jgi:hypothetical protein